jgi:hypothetical protein
MDVGFTAVSQALGLVFRRLHQGLEFVVCNDLLS